MKGRACLFALAAVVLIATSCGGDRPDLDGTPTPLTTDRTYFRDAQGRYVHLKGINLGGNIKVPVVNGTQDAETPQTYYGHVGDQVADAAAGRLRAFTYVGRPFSLQKADAYFAQMKALGFNSVRLMWNWEAVYPDRKGRPDRDYLNYYDELVQLAGKHGIYVMINLHENLWSRVFYSLYSEWPVCQQCCRYDTNDRAIDPKGVVHQDIVCTAERKAECCVKGDVMNMLWSLFPNRTRDELGITDADDVETRGRKYRTGFSHRVSGDGAPLWATQVCVPEKNFASPYWGVFKWLGTARSETGPLGLELFQTLNVALTALSSGNEPKIPADLAEKINAQLDRMEPYLPPDAFNSKDTYDGLPFTMWGINNGVSLATNICFAAFYAGDTVFPNRRVVEWGDRNKPDDGVTLEPFYTVEEAETRAAELRGAGHTHVVVNDLRESLQGGFRDAWVEIARIGKKYPHVIGYDILNEPAGVYLMLTVVQGLLDLGAPDLVKSLIDAVLLGDDGNPIRPLGASGSTVGELVQQLVEENLELMPGDNSDETRKALGVFGCDLLAAAGLNMHLDKNHLEPLYEYVGEGIAKVYDEGEAPANRLTLWLEPAHGLEMLFGGGGGVGGQYLQYATTPDIKLPAGFEERHGKVQFVWAPHWYPDIYPFVGLNQPSRTFASDEYDFRDYRPMIQEKADWAAYAYNNIPFVMGEFGTYWNFRYLENEQPCQEALARCKRAEFKAPACDQAAAICPQGWQQSRQWDYLISTQILDNYYEAYEDLFHSNMVWVYTPDAHPEYGDWWDHEDFSLVEFVQQALEPERYAAIPGSMPDAYIVPVVEPPGYVVPRGHQAFVRPYARAMSGKPIATHFRSDLHYFDPDKGVPNAVREFQVRFGGKETDAPTLVFVPELQYPDGFYVWLTDGYAVWDEASRLLHWFPERDEPGFEHGLRIRPPIDGQDDGDWNYFVQGGRVLTAR